jgi:hypothetical protein
MSPEFGAPSDQPLRLSVQLRTKAADPRRLFVLLPIRESTETIPFPEGELEIEPCATTPALYSILSCPRGRCSLMGTVPS